MLGNLGKSGLFVRQRRPKCKKIVEPIVADAMPNASIGNRTVVFSAFLHYFIGITISKIVTVFNTLTVYS